MKLSCSGKWTEDKPGPQVEMPDTTILSDGISAAREKALNILEILAVFLVFLLPLKFGIMTGLPEVAYTFPPLWIPVFISFWPPLLFSFLSSILLTGVIIIVPPPRIHITFKLLIPLSWTLLFLSVLPGFVNASTLDFPVIQLAVFSGLASFSIALFHLIEIRPGLKTRLVNAIVLSTIITAVNGIEQYYYGFRETIEYMTRQQQIYGKKLPGDLLNRMQQTRIFSTFSICNSLAGYLILTTPLCIWGIIKSRFIFKTTVILLTSILLFDSSRFITNQFLIIPAVFTILLTAAILLFKLPKRLEKYAAGILLVCVLFILLFVLRHTYSRGAFLAAGISLMFFIFVTPFRRSYKIIFFIFVTLIAGTALGTDIADRSLASMKIRIDYYLRALEMFIRHPLLGTGWGDFYHEYMRYKQYLCDEAPHAPHNMILSFMSQAGIAGLAASIAVIAAPFYIFFTAHRNNCATPEDQETTGDNEKFGLNTALITGLLAWSIHSMLDINIQVPGLAATAVTAALLLTSDSSAEKSEGTHSMSGKSLLVFWYGAAPLVALTAMLSSVHILKYKTSLTMFKHYCGMDINATAPPQRLTTAQLESILKNCTEKAKYSPVPWSDAALYAEYQHNWANAEKYIKEAIRRSPERASYYFHLATVQLHLDKNQEALKNMKKAAELFPSEYDSHYNVLKKQNGCYRQYNR